MKKWRIRKIIIVTIVSFIMVACFALWFNREKLLWLETASVIEKAYSIDLKKLEVECEYKNELRRFYENECRHGSMLVSFTCSPEYAEEVLVEYKDKLNEPLADDGEEELTEEEEFWKEVKENSLSRKIGVPKEELNGKKVELYTSYTRPFLPKLRCKCMIEPGFLYIQELEDGNVEVYIYYSEY